MKNTVYSFTKVEGDAYTLTRWLRARKYDINDTIQMVNEATAERVTPSKMNYYPDPVKALGVDVSTFISLYPQLYSGFAKNGCPVFYSKPGVLNIDGIECVTTLDGIINFHWHVMQHDYAKRLLNYKAENPSFVRFECVSILDLDQLTMSQLGSRTLEIIKKQATIDSLCFPETMNKMIIVNAPRFFSATWTIIKGFLDPRTSAKIDLFSSSSAAQKKLLEIIDESELPSDYGGTGESTNSILEREAKTNGRTRLVTEVISVRSSASFKLTINADEEVDLSIYTRATSGASFSVINADTKEQLIPKVDAIHQGLSGERHSPSSFHLTPAGRLSGTSGALNLKIKGEAYKTKVSSESFLLVANIYKK